MLHLHYVTAVTVARNVARSFFYSFLSSYSNYVKSRYVFSRFVKISVTGALRSVMDDSTFLPGLPRSVGTCHVLLRSDQALLCLSSSVKVFYDETWKPCV